jgi:hypothetical protein
VVLLTPIHDDPFLTVFPFSIANGKRFPRRDVPDVFSKLIPGIYWALFTSDFITGSVIRHSGAKGGQDGPGIAS